MSRRRFIIPPSTRCASSPDVLAFATMFGLSPHRAEVLSKLSTGKPMPVLRATVCALRRVLDTEAIDTTPRGYQLTEVGLKQCREAVAEFADWVTGRAA